MAKESNNQKAAALRIVSNGAHFGSRTDIGCVREHNEDSLVVRPPLFAVADGMGGHAAGEVASEIAVETLAERAPRHANAEELANAVIAANSAIGEAVQQGTGREGMGTTCTAALLEGERLVIAQVGDSRAYLLHQGALQQVTHDHSLVGDLVERGIISSEEARMHPKRSIITRALCGEPGTTPDLYELSVSAGDRLLLCSDGLTGMVSDAVIASTLVEVSDAQQCANKLVNEAIAAGGADNITVIVVDVAGGAARTVRKLKRRTKLSIAFAVLGVIAVLLAAVFGTRAAMAHGAYLIDEDGTVAIYQGIPGEVLGLSAHSLAYTTNIPTEGLQPGLAAHLQAEGVTVDSMDEALDLAESYAAELGINVVITPAGSQEPSAENAANAEAAEGADTSASAAAKTLEAATESDAPAIRQSSDSEEGASE